MNLLTSEFLRSRDIYGLHVGCREIIAPKWINTDISLPPSLEGGVSASTGLSQLPGGAYFLLHDATQRFPIEDGVFDRVYSEHFLEHLTLAEGIDWLREMRRLLKVGGVLRISTPDLGRYVEGYSDRKNQFYEQHREQLMTVILAVPKRKAWMMNQIFSEWGHRWIYDFEEVVYAAARAGFSKEHIVRRQYREGSCPTLSQMDREFRKDESLYVELVRS